MQPFLKFLDEQSLKQLSNHLYIIILHVFLPVNYSKLTSSLPLSKLTCDEMHLSFQAYLAWPTNTVENILTVSSGSTTCVSPCPVTYRSTVLGINTANYICSDHEAVSSYHILEHKHSEVEVVDERIVGASLGVTPCNHLQNQIVQLLSYFPLLLNLSDKSV